MRLLLVFVAAGALASPAHAALRPGDRAAIDVSVATLWKAPNLYRSLDRPSVTNPVDPVRWSANLATTESRVWLDSHVQTQALYGQIVTVLALQGSWAKVAVRDEPDPQDPHGYPGWLPLLQLKPAYDDSGNAVVVGRNGQLTLGAKTLALSYGTRLPLLRWDADSAVVRTPDGVGNPPGAEAQYNPTNASIIPQAK